MVMQYPIAQLLHWYLHKGNCAALIRELRCYHGVSTQPSVEVPVWALSYQGNSRATSKEQYFYVCVGNSALTVQ